VPIVEKYVSIETMCVSIEPMDASILRMDLSIGRKCVPTVGSYYVTAPSPAPGATSCWRSP
jgi:hypothetical protein